MGCSSSRINRRYPRLAFAQYVFEALASLGNPYMSTSHVVVVPRDRVLAWTNGFPKFEDCRADEHKVAADLVGLQDAWILFFSHRWQDAKNNLADSSDNIQYEVLKLYLESCDGQGITHVWIDLSCINQDRGTKDQPNPVGLEEFFIKLDNIGTAICCSAEVLVVPRLHQMEGVPEGHYYSDLREYTRRGWCIFESAMARLMGCEIRLGLVCGPVGSARFTLLGGSGLAPGEELSLKALRQLWERQEEEEEGHLQAAALACLPPPVEGGEWEGFLRRAARANWEAALDPAAVLADLYRFLREDLEFDTEDCAQRQAATLTMRLDAYDAPLAAKRVSALLPEEGFTAVRDKEVVTALLVNGGAFVLTGFKDVFVRSERELQELVLDHWCGGLTTLDLDSQGLLPCEVWPVLVALTTPGGGQEDEEEEGALVGFGGRPLCLRLSWNPIGPHGVRCLRDALTTGGLPPLRELNLERCGLGVAGALHLVDLLRDPAAAAALEGLDLGWNGVGAEGARALAAALPLCPTLRDLDLGWNEVGAEGARMLAKALPLCPALRFLDLQRNEVGAEGARALAKALPLCPTLRDLDLSDNEVGAEGARMLAEALPRCPALRFLGLRDNEVGEEAKAVVRAAWAVPLPDGTTRKAKYDINKFEEGGLDLSQRQEN